MKLTIYVNEDIVTARVGEYETSVKVDVPEGDIKDILEYLYDDHIVQELIRELNHEII